MNKKTSVKATKGKKKTLERVAFEAFAWEISKLIILSTKSKNNERHYPFVEWKKKTKNSQEQLVISEAKRMAEMFMSNNLPF